MFLFTSLHFPVASLITVYSCAPYLLSGLSGGNGGVRGYGWGVRVRITVSKGMLGGGGSS